MNHDSTLERIWDIRRRIYAACDHDPVKLVQYYIERQKENAYRLIYEAEIEQGEEDQPVFSPYATTTA
ncbi:hypothetical protein U27_04478 [Candidatus Vecturithrix granuli]|uniref:Uncharacterized protein n=1 Tax=Vecturithrix granuli TaxID=1499967 RepID=A0A081BYV6_VECG1|nr:hypothetical protein U27_04478 [Candidatus Vecturithrix granuli]